MAVKSRIGGNRWHLDLALPNIVFFFCIISSIIISLMNNASYTLIMTQSFSVITLCCLVLRVIMPRHRLTNKITDGRFFLVIVLCLYSVWGPFLAVITDVGQFGFRPLGNIRAANTYYANDIIETGWINIVFFLGILCGTGVGRNRSKYHLRSTSTQCSERNGNAEKYFRLWMIVSIVSTIVFLAPFFRGGFAMIASGRSIIDVHNSGVAQGIPSIVSVLLGAECMTFSTISMVYYLIKSDKRRSRVYLFVIILIAIQIIIMYTTSRRARALSIIIASLVMVKTDLDARDRKVKLRWGVAAVAMFAIVYLTEVVITTKAHGLVVDEGFVVYLLRQFDGLGPYDALLNSTRHDPDIAMTANVFYGVSRSILIFGKYILEIIGIDPSNSPMHIWLARHYPTIYSVGGGIASMPQLEAYLAMGHAGCFVYGCVYGVYVSRRRNGLKNVILIPISFMLARGDFSVLLYLMWTYYVYCHFVYEKILFRLIAKGPAPS